MYKLLIKNIISSCQQFLNALRGLFFFKAGCCWCLRNPLLLSLCDLECIL